MYTHFAENTSDTTSAPLATPKSIHSIASTTSTTSEDSELSDFLAVVSIKLLQTFSGYILLLALKKYYIIIALAPAPDITVTFY